MPRLFFKSFSSRLSFYILLLTTVIFVCIAAIFGHYTTDRANKHAELYSSALLKTILSDTELEIDDVEHLVEVIKDRVMANIGQPDSLMNIVADMVNKENIVMGGCVALEPGFYADRRRLFMEYAYLDEISGKLVRKHIDGNGYDYTTMDWYTRAKAAREPIWSEPYSDDGGGNRLMITYSLPMLNRDGEVFGVVTADVAIEELVDYINWMRPYSDGYTFIINSEGSYISHPDSTVVLNQNVFSRAKALNCEALVEIGRKMMARNTGADEFRLNGEKMIACYAPMQRTGWAACYVCPYRSIIDTMGDVLIYVYLVLLFWLLLLIVFIRRIIRRETRPMEQLTKVSYRISSGDFNTPLPDLRTGDEVQKLRDGFDYMQNSLRQYIEQLTDATRTKERIASELTIAHDIQMSLVPHRFSPFEGYPTVDIHALLTPAKEVGGDFYDFLFRDRKLYFAIADVSGKGVPAALIMAITRSRFRLFCEGLSSPAEIVSGLNRAFCEENDAYMFVTMFVGILDIDSNTLTYCNAGHNPPVVVAPGNKARFMAVVPNLPIGIEPNFNYEEQRAQIVGGETLLLYTDGVTEAERIDHEQFGEQRLLDELSKSVGQTSQSIVNDLQQRVNGFVDGAEPSDDLTLLCIKLQDMAGNHCGSDGEVRTLPLTNSLSELDKLHDFVADLARENSIEPDVAMQIDLALEEAVVNIIDYAYPKDVVGEIVVTAAIADNTLQVTITDSGRPFDPTMAPEPDTTLPLEQREIGGLGIHLIRTIMDSVTYSRLPSANCLSLTKRLSPRF
jgi:sigma-B regulation protein RsbU (phosphoserine phosphatase)